MVFNVFRHWVVGVIMGSKSYSKKSSPSHIVSFISINAKGEIAGVNIDPQREDVFFEKKNWYASA
ncbi:MAG TPA: hypothetical protein VD794_07740, partial [Flavisolibacter sp.]|nr:hypothetical protein [Flavisolibacter sp.]